VIRIFLTADRLLTLADVIHPAVGPDDNPLVGINIGRNPNIKSLHIANIRMQSPFTERRPEDEEVLELLKHFLSDVGGLCRLEKIKLDLKISGRHGPIDWSPLDGVDRILAGTDFKSLGTVYIELFSFGSFKYDWYPEACENVARRFPLLRAGGVSVDVD
jgi:hypothetical protein